MRRGIVVYRCGAEATVLYPDGEEDVLLRRRHQAAREDCPYCRTGVERDEGWELRTGGGRVDLWKWTDVTPEEAKR